MGVTGVWIGKIALCIAGKTQGQASSYGVCSYKPCTMLNEYRWVWFFFNLTCLLLILNFQVSNHVASMDDPLVIASLLPPQVLLDARNLRWTLCATDRCFKNPVTSAFFRSVKVLPLSRGDGIYQEVWIK